MMKQARTLLSRSLYRQSKSAFEEKAVRGFECWSFYPITALPQRGRRQFIPFAVFKGKATLSVEPILPSFTQIDSGNLRIKRRGSLLMTFTPAIRDCTYDWKKRQMFALSPSEVGSLISMGSKERSEFSHDHSMKSSNAGQVKKSLSFEPHAINGGGYLISLTVNNNILNTNDRFVVPVTTAEFAELKTRCRIALPYIIRWKRRGLLHIYRTVHNS